MKPLPHCVVYCFRNAVSDKVYVGSTIRLVKRKKNHYYTLRRNTHFNTHLQSSWNEYGEQAFSFHVLEVCTPETRLSREQFWIDYYDAANPSKGYNMSPTAAVEYHTEESRRKISESNKRRYQLGRTPFLKGKTHSAEVKQFLGDLHRGKVVSLETRTKQSIARRGMKLTDEHRKRIGDASRGRKQSAELVKKRTSHDNWAYRPILQIDLRGQLVARHKGVVQAAISSGCSSPGIMDCAKGRRNSFKGYIWKYDT